MISVVMALYNEEKRFLDTVARLKDLLASSNEEWEIILVDDGSTDGTLSLIRGLMSSHPNIRGVSNVRNMGQGACLKMGFLLTRGDIVAYSDADLSVPLHYLKQLIELVRSGRDVVIASRWRADSKIGISQPPLRKYLGRVYYALIHGLFMTDIQDTNCGLKAYRGDVARMIYGFVRSWRWAFNVEHLWLARRAGHSIIEIPIEWNHKEGSKVHVFRDCFFTLWEILNIKLRQLTGIYPRWKV